MNGWHPGEVAIRRKTGLDKDSSTLYHYTMIKAEMPEQHSEFYSTRLPFLPVTILDEHGRPWGSILAGDGNRGFIAHPRYNTLVAKANVWEGDPIRRMGISKDGTALIAGIGVEFSTRRRNKLAGRIKGIEKKDTWEFEIEVNEAIGNCPKYIPVRDLVPHSSRKPKVLYETWNMSKDDKLPDYALSLIQQSDTIFFGSTHDSRDERFPSHVGMNIRGGRPGFVRASSDGRTLVIPDYSGNQILTSLGNVEATPLASITFLSFTTGSILYVTGRARNLVGEEASKLMFQQDRLTTVYVTGCVFIENALPVRQREGTGVQLSPYSPPLRYLAEENKSRKMLDQEAVEATLIRMELHAPNIATFTFATSAPLDITPGQAIILDLKSFIGVPKYQHMAPNNPVSLNDDRVRTWTVTAISPSKSEFAITLKLKPQGAASGALFMIAHKVPPAWMADARCLDLKLPVLGVTGEFDLRSGEDKKKVLMIAGGIGVTPFLCMLKYAKGWDVRVLLATREPGVLVPLVLDAAQGAILQMDVFSSSEEYTKGDSDGVALHRSRLTTEFIVERQKEWEDRIVFVCGPGGIQDIAKDGLARAGVSSDRIKSEGFAY